MRVSIRWSFLAVFTALWAVQAQAQTVDDVIEKHLGALGGRGALAKLESRIATGSIVVSTEGADIGGSLEIYFKAPNKSRTYIKLDLSQYGGPEIIIDRRCDGKAAFASNSAQGDQEITGNQLQNLLNSVFPSPLLAYKEAGAKIELVGKDKIGDRPVYVLVYTPRTGPSTKQFYDAETYLLLRSIVTVDSPELGGQIESTNDLSDYRAIDGVKTAFAVKVVNSAQTVVISLSKVEHNAPLDDAMFSRAAAK